MAEEKKPLTPRQQALIDALIGEAQGDIRKAMRIAGYADGTSTSEAIKPIKEHVIEAAQFVIAMHAPRAAMGIIGVINAPATLGARNVVAAAKEVLDRAGVVKVDQIKVETDGGGIFILPAKNVEKPNE